MVSSFRTSRALLKAKFFTRCNIFYNAAKVNLCHFVFVFASPLRPWAGDMLYMFILFLFECHAAGTYFLFPAGLVFRGSMRTSTSQIPGETHCL